MRTQGSSADHRSVTVVPSVLCNHPDDVAEVSVVAEYRIAVRFNDGTSGIVDLGRLVQEEKAGVFAELRDPAIFATVGVDLGAVTWPNGIDLAPDAMYAALRAKGEWILE